MAFRRLRVRDLLVNRANDRHGELENETAAIAHLFRTRETHMRNLARDIADTSRLMEPPLVFPEGDHYLVMDGNRRVTCLKLLLEPRRAPTADLQRFFGELHNLMEGRRITRVECQVEDDRDEIDEILYRRHTGARSGVGQSTWDDRAKTTFLERTGRNDRVNVAGHIEHLLDEAHRLPDRRVPRSNVNRLLSSEAYRSRLGISVRGNEFRVTHEPVVVLNALARLADDFASGRVTLNDVWDHQGKRNYLDGLARVGLLPRDDQRLPAPDIQRRPRHRPRAAPRPIAPQNLIPNHDYQIAWTAELQRHREIWEELQFHLTLAHHPNAISALLRILLELTVEYYITRRQLRRRDTLSRNVGVVANDLFQRGLITEDYNNELNRIRQNDELISVASLHRFVHSDRFAPMAAELTAYWTRLGEFLRVCLAP
jgi:hypothetical protein